MSTDNRVNMIKLALNKLEPTVLTLEDQSSIHEGHVGAKSGGHYFAHIVSPLFSGKNLIQRHKMVYEALGDLMKTDIHAFSMQAKTPEE